MKSILRGLAWAFFGSLLLGGGIGTLMLLSSKNQDAPVAPFVVQLIFGALGCFYLYRSKKTTDLHKAERDKYIEETVASPLVAVVPRQAIIKAGETAYCGIFGALMEEKTVGYKAGTRGASVRIAKGVTLRTSGTRAMPIKDLVAVSQGELVITDKRLIFAGDRKSFVIPNGDILNTTNYNDGFGFTDGDKTYTVGVKSERNRILMAATLHKVLRT